MSGYKYNLNDLDTLYEQYANKTAYSGGYKTTGFTMTTTGYKISDGKDLSERYVENAKLFKLFYPEYVS